MKTFIDSSSKDVSLVLDINELITLRRIVAYGVSSIAEEIDQELPDNPLESSFRCAKYRDLRDFLDSSTTDLVYQHLGLS